MMFGLMRSVVKDLEPSINAFIQIDNTSFTKIKYAYPSVLVKGEELEEPGGIAFISRIPTAAV